MRERNMRLAMTGGGLIVLAIVFFAVMLAISGKSNDPIAMMQTVGEVTGIACAIGIVMVVLGLIGKPKA